MRLQHSINASAMGHVADSKSSEVYSSCGFDSRLRHSGRKGLAIKIVSPFFVPGETSSTPSSPFPFWRPFLAHLRFPSHPSWFVRFQSNGSRFTMWALQHHRGHSQKSIATGLIRATETPFPEILVQTARCKSFRFWLAEESQETVFVVLEDFQTVQFPF